MLDQGPSQIGSPGIGAQGCLDGEAILPEEVSQALRLETAIEGDPFTFDAGLLTINATVENFGGVGLTVNGAGNTTVTGVIRDSTIDAGILSLTKADGGVLTLSGANTFTGGLTINGGTVGAMTSDAALGSGNVTFGGNSTLNIENGRNLGNGILINTGITGSVNVAGTDAATLSGVIANGTGAGLLAKDGTGTLILSGANTFTGGLTLNAGALTAMTSNAALGAGTVTFAGNSTLNIENGRNLGNGILINNGITGSVNVAGTDAATLSGVIADGTGAGVLAKDGTGILVMSNANTFTGGVNINGGTLSVATIANNTVASNLGAGGGIGFDGGTLLYTGGANATTDRVLTFNAGGGTLNVATMGTNLTLTSAATGAGRLTKGGAGTLIFGASNDYAGATMVTAGTLTVNAAHTGAGLFTVGTGAILNGTSTVGGGVTVDAGGTLSGLTGITGALMNSGIVSVRGNNTLGTLNVGTLTVAGAMSNLQFDVTNTTAGTGHDQIASAGAVSLAGGGTVTAVNNNADEAILANQKITLIDGTGAGTAGTPTLALQGFDFLTGTLNFNAAASDLFLTFNLDTAAIGTALNQAGATPNQTAVGMAIANAVAAGENTAEGNLAANILSPLLQLNTNAEITAALEQLSPESHVGATNAAIAANTQILGAALQGGGLGGGLGGGPGFNLGGNNSEELASRVGSSPLGGAGAGMVSAFSGFQQMFQSAVYGAPDHGRGRLDRHDTDDQAWAIGFGNWSRLDATTTTQGFRSNGGSAVVGRTWKKNERSRWGVHGGYAESGVDTVASPNNSEIDTWNIGLHGSHAGNNGFYFDGALGYSKSEIDSQRFVPSGLAARADRDADAAYAYGEFGKTYDLGDDSSDAEGGWYAQPQLALQYQHISEDAFVETGAGAANLAIARNTLNMFQSALGARFFRTIRQDDGGWLVPDLRVRWGHEFGDVNRDVTANFVGTSQIFQVNGRQQDRDTVQVRGGITAYTKSDLDIDLGYYGEFASGQKNNAAVLRIVKSW